MKKELLVVLCFFLALSMIACKNRTVVSGNQEDNYSSTQGSMEDTTQSFDKYNISEELQEIYYSKFQYDFSVEEYIDFVTIAEGYGAKPSYPVGEYFFIAVKEEGTYNSIEYICYMFHPSGRVLYEGEMPLIPPEDCIEIGEYIFVPSMNGAEYEVYNAEGDHLGTCPKMDRFCKEIRNLGNGYFILAFDEYYIRDNGIIYIWKLNECCNPILQRPIGADNRPAVYGEVSEGLFAVMDNWDFPDTIDGETIMSYDSAGYFDLTGHVVLNLSYDKTNYHIYEMGAFKSGQAEIKFVGADKKYYTAVIDINGNFLQGPTVQEGK